MASSNRAYIPQNLTHCEQSRVNYENRLRFAKLAALHCVQRHFCHDRGIWVRYHRDSGELIDK